ncbi:MAG: protein kinase, partial [Gammaproteobacteria bacterium]|nr:protein kinase [Gammaproteobacteria bacterium]
PNDLRGINGDDTYAYDSRTAMSLGRARVPIEAGQQLLHYRLVEKIGEGGMGVVWKAVDTTLDREVAIKVLPPAFAEDPERLARFEREAKLLAAFNHQGIAGIYGLHTEGGAPFLAMEFIPGNDLAALVRTAGALPLEQVLDVGRQIAEALEAAHENGIVHRDLKPANVMLTPEGHVKVLDFGLAKAVEAEQVSGHPSMSPTLTSAGTVAGVILGTAGYMSPEQARGRVADKRSDLWALGCVLFEMLTGAKAFSGDTVSDTLASVLKTEPDWQRLPTDTPQALRRLLRRCLNKDAAQRLHDAADARLELNDA